MWGSTRRLASAPTPSGENPDYQRRDHGGQGHRRGWQASTFDVIVVEVVQFSPATVISQLETPSASGSRPVIETIPPGYPGAGLTEIVACTMTVTVAAAG